MYIWTFINVEWEQQTYRKLILKIHLLKKNELEEMGQRNNNNIIF